MGDIEITSISVETGEMHVQGIVASVCYNSSNTRDYDKSTFEKIWSLDPAFRISPTENVFTAIGCDALAFLEGGFNWNYFTGCISYCTSLNDSAPDGSTCAGLGCCQSSIPGNLSMIEVGWNTGNSTTNNSAWDYSPCNHAFVAQKDSYRFRRQDLKVKGNGNDILNNTTLVLDWAIRDKGSCDDMRSSASGVSGNLPAPACASAHSYCEDLNATRGGGYLCKCLPGYTGNPYTDNGDKGCTDIDECTRLDEFPCLGDCTNTDGSYECKCPHGSYSDGDPKEKPCNKKISDQAKRLIGIIISTSILAFIILGTGACYIVKRIEKRAKERELEAIERKNGSERLKNVKTLKFFTKEELDQITLNNSVPLGKGGFGEVHKGTLSDKTEVAVKASNEVTQATVDEFAKEVEIQSRMMHRNILKLLGCCLRVDVPLLVYEYAAKGSLQEILHGKNNDQQREPLTLRSRLEIATGSAQGLAYMHSYTENGIQHADVKPDNILLDGGLVPKISDFGLSKVFVEGKQYTMNVTGCLSYMDPVYKDTGRLTPKSDVYSFGIVLLEIICRRPVGYGESSLVKQFKKVYEEYNTGKALFDKDIAEEEDIAILDEIGILALKCLNEKVDERPAMASVASALVILKDSWEEKGQRFSSTSIE